MVRFAKTDDYDAAEPLMEQVQPLHVELRPDVYRAFSLVLSPAEFQSAAAEPPLGYCSIRPGM